MDYTIAVMEDVNFGDKLSLSKRGNVYTVNLMNSINQLTFKIYNDLDSATKAFTRISMAILKSEYSYKERCQML